MSTLNRHTTEPTIAYISNNGGHFENNQRSFPQPIVQTSTPASPPNPRLEKYLELCVNVGEHNITLAELRISTSQSQITTDGELFQEIRKSYGKRRGLLRTHSLHLFKPAKVDFVQVNVVRLNCRQGLTNILVLSGRRFGRYLEWSALFPD